MLHVHATADADGAGGVRPRPTILVVDDDALVRRLSRLALDQAGYGVVEATDGLDALRLVDTHDVDLVLLDGQMPGLSGREVVARLRARADTATLPVLLVTADGAMEDRLSGLDAGADDYITKPFSLEEMVARVRAHLRAHEAWRETLAAHARQRSALARALEVAGRQTTLETTAAVLCGALAGQEGVRSSALVRFTADGGAVPVALCGPNFWGLASGDRAPVPVRAYLTARARGGPWIELPDAPTARPAAVTGAPPVACVPFGEDDAVHGLLLLALRDRSRHDANTALGAAIDFAAVAHGLLRRRLVEQHRAEADRMELRSVLAEGAFRPHFQPIVRMDTGAVIGAEALTRFSDGASPESRFREAAARGLGTDLELATLQAALREATDLTPPDAWISLNVSPVLLLTELEALERALAVTDRDVVLELSEQEAVSDYGAMRDALASVGGGVRLSIDDAGSGFASLRHILRLEPDFVKLDRSWIHGVDGDPARQAMIAGLRHFADQTGAQLVAEGIEVDAERDVLIDLRVELGQGYLFGRPAALTG